jgi:hypothetical protein
VNFNEHSNLKGAHAFLSASKYHWDRYDEDKLVESFRTSMAAARGTKLHEIANPLELYIFEAYAAMEFSTAHWNTFRTH